MKLELLLVGELQKLFLENADNDDNVKECYNNLIKSLKDSDLYAPSYTLLGILFQDYYGDTERAQKCFTKRLI